MRFFITLLNWFNATIPDISVKHWVAHYLIVYTGLIRWWRFLDRERIFYVRHVTLWVYTMHLMYHDYGAAFFLRLCNSWFHSPHSACKKFIFVTWCFASFSRGNYNSCFFIRFCVAWWQTKPILNLDSKMQNATQVTSLRKLFFFCLLQANPPI